MNGPIASGCTQGQFLADQRPKFDNQLHRGRRPNQVIGKKSGIIRPDKRKKVKFL